VNSNSLKWTGHVARWEERTLVGKITESNFFEDGEYEKGKWNELTQDIAL
jgi:hypothetical protein